MIWSWPTASETKYVHISSGASGKESACQFRRHETRVGSLGQVVQWSLEKGMATHSSILAWKIPWQATVYSITWSRT